MSTKVAFNHSSLERVIAVLFQSLLLSSAKDSVVFIHTTFCWFIHTKFLQRLEQNIFF